MSSILKVDTIQDQDGNNIINENANTITIGASGDTINIIGTLQNNGGALPGDISSVVAGTGLSGGGTTGAVTLNIEAAQPTITSLGTLTGLTTTGDIIFGDDDKAIFGASSDLKIYHNGSSIISEEGGGTLQLRTNGPSINLQKENSEDMAVFTADGSVSLWYDNVKKFETTSTGAIISGGLVLDYGSVNGNPRITFDQDNITGSSFIEVDRNSLAMEFYNNGSERMRITSGGNVGIGTSSPSLKLEVSGDVKANNFTNRTSLQGIDPTPDDANRFELGAGYLNLYRDDTAEVNQIQFGKNGTLAAAFSTGANYLAIKTNGDNERMRIDSSGNVLVGKTAANYSTPGIDLKSNGNLVAIRDSGNVVNFVRNSNDGSIVTFAKDTTNFGSIGVNGDNLVIDGLVSAHTGLDFANDKIIPRRNNAASNNTVDLGYSSGRFKDIYLGGGAYLGGTAAANKLEDYEEGTWTGTIGNGSSTFTMGSNTGSYIKIGSLVFLSGYFTVSNTNSITSGNARLSGLPFANGSANSSYASVSIAYAGTFTITAGETIGFSLDTSASHLNFREWNSSTGTTNVTMNQFASGTEFMLSFTYRTDA